MASSARDLLQTYNANSLQQMIKSRGLTAAGKNKDALIQALAPVLYDSDAIQRSLADLEPVERVAIDRLILGGGALPTSIVRNQLEHEGLIDPPPKPASPYYGYSYYGRQERGSPRNRGSRRFPDIVARLSALGLVFTAEPIQSTGTIVDAAEPGRRLFIPAEILRQLPPVTYPVETTAAPAEIQTGDAATLVRDLYSLLSFAAQESIQLTARGGINKRTIGRINQGLRRQEEIAPIRTEEDLGWLPFLRALAEELGLLAGSVGELVVDSRSEEFLRLPATERRQRLFAAYHRTGRWNELFRLPDLEVSGKGMNLRIAPDGVIAARRRVLTEIGELSVGEWVAIDHLIERLRRRSYEFLLSRRRTPQHYYYSYGADQAPNPYPGPNELGMTFVVSGEAAGWDLVEAGFIRAIVTEALPAFGIVDLGGAGAATVLRVTPDGARLLRGEALPIEERQANVVIQPNFQIFAFEPTSEDVLFTLDQIANRIRAEQASEYELTRESIYRAQRAGFDAARVIAFLESVSTVGLPQNVRRTLEEWGGELERITLRRRTPLLHVAEAATLDALIADPKLAPLLGRRLTPTVAFLPSANVRALGDRLRGTGRLPALTEGPDLPTAPPPASLTVDDDGGIAFRQRLPSVYDLALLRPFVELGENDTPRLTPDSLRRGARAGLAADDILATLRRLHAGPLSDAVAALVRRWAKDWGRGALFQATILQVDQPGILSDLLADPEVKAYLEPIPGAPTLAIVRADALDRVHTRLDARGMSLEDRPFR